MTEDAAGTGADITVAHSARICNYWLGGKGHCAPIPQGTGLLTADFSRARFPGRPAPCLADRPVHPGARGPLPAKATAEGW